MVASRKRRSSRLIYVYDLVRELVSRDLKLLYKRSMLGIAWTLISPLLQLAVFAFVFRSVLRVDVPNFASFAFSGLLIWTWTQTSLFQATGLITNNRPLIRQPRFPVAILPIVTVTTGLIHFLLALPVLVVFLAIEGVHLTPIVLLLPILFALQFVLTVSVAYPLAALNVTFRDTQHTLGVLLQLMFYVLPIFYDVSNVPERFRSLYLINPMVLLLEAYRDILLRGELPDPRSLLSLAIVAIVLLPIGYRIFKHQSHRFVEEI
ncbi:ABC transporter permease [Microcoleus sp. FACHB-1515]|uniref:ABC transporter permease n=1 Tax=Cyanophyceae TaxID=3028117 RepID=UPI001683621B|nr:ABC transporter permease [Microcoleus sp. FACHB-1515]MBD2092214.1 ABC transporter permease [Microcoleus sp. FACHB-1515]